jgi:hypothetical protein
LNTINIIIPEVYKNFDVINVSGGTLTFAALNKSFRNYQTTVSGNFQLSVLSTKPGGDYKLLITKNTAVDVIVSLPINSVLIGDPTGSTITLSGSIGEQFLIEFSYDGINLLFILGGGSSVEPGASSGFSPNVIPFINTSSEWSEDTNFNYINGNLGVGLLSPSARLHVKGNSNTVGNIFVAENLSNTANLTIGNNGVSTFNFSTVGGKVYIAGAVGSGETLLEIRRTVSSSGGFIFRSNNSSSQSFSTTNGALTISTPDNSNINLSMGSGILTIASSPSMSAINTGQRMMLGTLASSSLSRWINIGYNSTLGQIIQSVQNGSVPTNDNLSLNPYGGNVSVGNISATATLHVKGNSDTVGNVLLVESLTGNRVLIGNNGYHGLNTITVGTTALTVEHPYPSANNYLIVDFKQSITRFTLDTDGRLVWVAGKFSTYDDNSIISTFRAPSTNTPEIRFSAAGNLHFGLSNRTAKIGRKVESAFGRLWYYADINSGGLVGQPMHGFESNSEVGSTVGFTTQFMQLRPVGGTGTSTSINSFRWLDMVTSSAINLDNPNTTIFAIDYNPTITSYNGAHYGLVIRPSGTLNGIGLTTNLPTATWHIKGNSDSVGTVFRAENLSNTARLSFNNNGVLNFLGNPATTSSATFLNILNGSTEENLFSIESGGNAYSLTMRFRKSSLYDGGDTTMGVQNSGGVSRFLINHSGQLVMTQLINDAVGVRVQPFATTGNIDVFGGRRAFEIGGATLGASSGTGSYTHIRISSTINQTGGTASFTGLDYNPTVTSITGAHYGLLIRPSGTLNGIGLGTTLPTATLQVKGNSDTTGNTFRVENLSNTASFNFQNNGTFQFSAPFGVIAMRDTFGELLFGSTSIGAARYITQGFEFGSNLSSTRFTGVTIINGAGSTSLNATSGNYRLFQIIGNHQSNSAHSFNPTTGNASLTHININTYINQTGTASGIVVGYDYNPTIVSILGAHYGLLIRPNTLNGFGLGSTLPTALLDLEGSTTARASLRIRTGVAPSAPNDGDIWNDGTDLFVRIGGTTYTLQKI